MWLLNFLGPLVQPQVNSWKDMAFLTTRYWGHNSKSINAKNHRPTELQVPTKQCYHLDARFLNRIFLIGLSLLFLNPPPTTLSLPLNDNRCHEATKCFLLPLTKSGRPSGYRVINTPPKKSKPPQKQPLFQRCEIKDGLFF